jgi:hypothetical protein
MREEKRKKGDERRRPQEDNIRGRAQNLVSGQECSTVVCFASS